jgi:hypothetical protein
MMFSPQNGFLKSFDPIPTGDYPVFNKYPEFIVNYKIKMREKIKEEEEEYLRKRYDMRRLIVCRKVNQEMSRLADELKSDKKVWNMAEWRTDEVVEKWWQSVLTEQERYVKKKAELFSMGAEERAQGIQQIASGITFSQYSFFFS